MTETARQIDRLAPTRRPHGKPAGYQTWSNLLFVHWRVPAEELRPLIPEPLSVDTFDGSAWVGLVAFEMSGVRPRWFPEIPGVSRFAETNVRTYVHHRGSDPGVWFFSLDASCALAVLVARWRWKLAYYRSTMQVDREGSRIHYESHRRWPQWPNSEVVAPSLRIDAELGEFVQAVGRQARSGRVVAGTLEHFLVERYVLYVQDGAGRLRCGRVHHRPYPVRHAEVLSLQQSLLPAAGILTESDPVHVLFSDGVSVEVFPLRTAIAKNVCGAELDGQSFY